MEMELVERQFNIGEMARIIATTHPTENGAEVMMAVCRLTFHSSPGHAVQLTEGFGKTVPTAATTPVTK
ncbi:hypothetical protein Cadr_000005127 [Camelus dromedarius]|uniref:Uncharacterized protein n=1 Tax=Camelus dromedarius TaxID=9838 RepID=A0A5N4E1N4_CAMDR|nr:hypothetical protein Cadr_000005127 [Camelus dromedarius]